MKDMYILPDWAYLVIIPLAIWAVFWKGLALWHAARRGNTVWFIVLLLVNTVGILEIIYLMLSGKLKTNELFKKSDDKDN